MQQTIRDIVAAIPPLDQQETMDIADITAWIDSGVELFRRQKPDIPPKHLVSYFVLVDPDHKSILLVDHIKAQLWLPTGGHVQPSEHPRDAAIRECSEELQLKAQFLHGNDMPFFATVTQTVGLTPGHTDVSLWYLLRGDIHTYIKPDKREFHEVEWFSFDEILSMDPVIFDPHLQRFVRKLDAYLS